MSYCSSEIVNQGCKLSISFKFMVGQQRQRTVSTMGCSQKINSFFCLFLRTLPYSAMFQYRKLAQSPKVHMAMGCVCLCLLLLADKLVISTRRNTLFSVLVLGEVVIQV